MEIQRPGRSKRGGDGTFAPLEEKLAPSELARTVALGDLNGDGKLDLATVSSTGRLLIILNTTPS